MRFYLKKNLVFILLLSTGTLPAQPYYDRFKHKKDSLTEVLKKFASPDTGRASALYNILNTAKFLKEKKEVMPFLQEAIKLSRKLKYRKIEVACLLWIGNYYKSAHKMDSAIIYLDSGIYLVNSSADTSLHYLKGNGFFEKGIIYESQQNLNTALQYYFEALKNYNASQAFMQKNTWWRIGAIYELLGNSDKALQYYKASENYGALAKIYYNRNDFSNARYYLDKLKPEMPDTIETQVTGGYYRLLGGIYAKENKPDSAAMYLQEALKYFNYNRDVHIVPIAIVLTDIARLKIESGDMALAKKYAEQSAAVAAKSGNKEAMIKARQTMAAYYSKTGNYPGAYHAMQEAGILNDSLITEENIKQANNLGAIYENDKKEKEIMQLQADRKIQAVTVKQKSLLNTIFIIALTALLITGALLYRNVKHKQMLISQQQLIQQQKIIQLEKEKQLMAVEAMLQGQEEERARLAKDLHDGLGGMLSGIKISFSNMKENMIMDAANLADFEKSIMRLDNTIEELRKISHNLMPEALVKFGLKNAVKDFCMSVQSEGSIKIICEQLGDERELGSIADVNVYRIIQELVNNAVKYAQPNQILVQLTKIPNKVLITVEDNGKGFDLKELEKSSGIGFANIKYRVNYLNGTIEINSKPGDGTTVNIELTA